MCGIVAVVSSRNRPDVRRVEAALDRIAHRGPDGRGTWQSPSGEAVLGHVRLAIVDLDGGAQPMVSRDGQTAVTVNGEIYDSPRLLDALAARGHAVATRSDSEIALHAYREMGTACTKLLRGELAFALWDEEKKRLFCVRDRFGIKPLFYARANGALYVASEVKALFAAGVPAAWDDDGAYRALSMALPEGRTLYRDVKQVPPGHFLVFENGNLTIERYWDLDFGAPLAGANVPSLPEAIHETGRLLDDAVTTRLRADVPIGCYLSGGVDSSAVLALAQRAYAGKIKAFTVSFDDEAFDEREPATNMARHAGCAIEVVSVPKSAFADDFAAGVETAEIPPLNGHGPARYSLSRAVHRAGIKVVLGGEGADELFGGYGFLQVALGKRRAPKLSSIVDAVARAFDPTARRAFASVSQVSPTVAWLLRFAGFPTSTLGYLSEKIVAIRGIFADDFVARHARVDPYRDLLATMPWSTLRKAEPFRVLTHLWMKTHFASYILAAERLDMAHGVEQRLPFLDHRLFEYVRKLPASLLVTEGENKALLRKTVAPVVTAEVLSGAKKPFFAPPTASSRTSALYMLSQDLVRSESFAKIPFFSRARVVALFDALDRGPEEDRARLDPLYFYLSGMAVLSEAFRLG